MKHKTQPNGIRGTILTGLSILLILLGLCIAEQVKAAPITLNADTRMPNKMCANGFWAVDECLPGYVIYGPVIRFTDLISGPKTGLGDGLGDGVIVTIWGQNLGSSQGNSTIQFIDSNMAAHNGHVYYWKDADGALPSGPSNLYESHKMQEIAFSIPAASADGLGMIRVTVNEQQWSTPFTVRAGSIYHVTPTGNDTTGDGSFAKPWLTVAKADSTAEIGSTLYLHGTDTYGEIEDTNTSKQIAIYNNRGFLATEANQFSYVSYPNTQANLYGRIGFAPYLTSGIVTSKLSVFASNCTDETLTNCTGGSEGIKVGDWGRAIGNKITDRSGMCANGQSGAIAGGVGGASGTFTHIEGAKIYGNFVHDYACPNTDKLHHTTYFSIRNPDDPTITPFDVGWNYLKNNHAKYGIHVYDEDNSHTSSCGDLSGDLLIHDNVIIDQGAAGINYGIDCGWTQDTRIYNNVVIRSGNTTDIDCVSSCGSSGAGISLFDGENNGDIYVYNNTIIDWDDGDIEPAEQGCIAIRGGGNLTDIIINDNVCETYKDREYVEFADLNATNNANLKLKTSGNRNAFYTSAVSPERAIPPDFDANPIVSNPLLTVTGAQVSVGFGSPLINQSSTTLVDDIYGSARPASSNVGAVQ